MNPSSVRRAWGAALLLAVGLAGPAGAAELTARYTIRLLGVPLAEAEFTLQRRDGRPGRARLQVASAGAGGAVGRLFGKDFESRDRAVLQPGPGGVVPRRYVHRDQQRRVTYRYGDDGRLRAIDVEPAADRQRYRVPKAALRRAPPLHNGITAFVAVLETVARTGRCEGRVPVFTGRARFDLVATDRGPVPEAGNLGGQATGPARRCRLARVVPEEHSFPAKLARLEAGSGAGGDDEAAEAWIVPVTAGAVLQRFSVPTRFGTARALLQRLRIDGRDGVRIAQRPF